MTKDKSIYIKNIYYMLSYAFQCLKRDDFADIASETFHNVEDLFAKILCIGVSQQIKQGLYREYITKNESLPLIRGRIDLKGSIYNIIQRKQQVSCFFDELSENNLYNMILKTTIYYLLISDSVKLNQKISLKKDLLFFDTIKIIDPSMIPWDKLHYHRNNQNYEMLINICYFVLHGMLQTTEKGQYKMHSFSDEDMARLYEKFILEYYKLHYAYLKPKSGKVEWNLDSEKNDKSIIKYLPDMKTDIMLIYNENKDEEKILIIDAKYYGKALQNYWDKNTLHSSNLYQIFTYVKNKDKNNKKNVGGILLYAKTEDDIIPQPLKYTIGGNQIGALTLDLNKDFSEIAFQLNKIVSDYFGQNSASFV